MSRSASFDCRVQTVSVSVAKVGLCGGSGLEIPFIQRNKCYPVDFLQLNERNAICRNDAGYFFRAWTVTLQPFAIILS